MKSLDNFTKGKAQCRSCLNAYRQTIRDRHGDQHKAYIKEYNKTYYAKNREKALKWGRDNKRKYILAKYGLTESNFQKMVDEQNNRCKLCASKPKTHLYVDHDHTTGKIRGLLCHSCNVALGLFKDNITTLSNAILYLKGETSGSPNGVEKSDSVPNQECRQDAQSTDQSLPKA